MWSEKFDPAQRGKATKNEKDYKQWNKDFGFQTCSIMFFMVVFTDNSNIDFVNSFCYHCCLKVCCPKSVFQPA